MPITICQVFDTGNTAANTTTVWQLEVWQELIWGILEMVGILLVAGRFLINSQSRHSERPSLCFEYFGGDTPYTYRVYDVARGQSRLAGQTARLTIRNTGSDLVGLQYHLRRPAHSSRTPEPSQSRLGQHDRVSCAAQTQRGSSLQAFYDSSVMRDPCHI